jgi:hypothetical protein
MDAKELPQNHDKVCRYQDGLENPELEERRQASIRQVEKNEADEKKNNADKEKNKGENRR